MVRMLTGYIFQVRIRYGEGFNMQVWKISKDGFYTGETYFVDENESNEVITPLLVGYLKPKWNGTEWVEGANDVEIKQWEDNLVIVDLSPLESERIAILEQVVMEILITEMGVM